MIFSYESELQIYTLKKKLEIHVTASYWNDKTSISPHLIIRIAALKVARGHELTSKKSSLLRNSNLNFNRWLSRIYIQVKGEYIHQFSYLRERSGGALGLEVRGRCRNYPDDCRGECAGFCASY